MEACVTSVNPRHAVPAGRHQPAAAAAAMAPVLVVLVGCGGTARSVPLPAKPPAACAVTRTAAASSPRQQVITALVGYTAALRLTNTLRSAGSPSHTVAMRPTLRRPLLPEACPDC
jgi:hypothetical protein